MAMLEVKELQVYYGVIQALKDVSFEVNQGEVIALIGANGAGKTTTLHTLTGLLPAKHGSIMFEGVDITKMPAHKIVEMGIAHVPEGTQNSSAQGNRLNSCRKRLLNLRFLKSAFRSDENGNTLTRL